MSHQDDSISADRAGRAEPLSEEPSGKQAAAVAGDERGGKLVGARMIFVRVQPESGIAGPHLRGDVGADRRQADNREIDQFPGPDSAAVDASATRAGYR